MTLENDDDIVDLNLIRNGKTESTQSELVFELLDYARTFFMNITPPICDLNEEHSDLFYWVCDNLNELARRTGDRIEFNLQTVGRKPKLTVFSYRSSPANNYINQIVKAVEREDLAALRERRYMPSQFIITDDPLTQKGNRLRRQYDELQAELDADDLFIDEEDGAYPEGFDLSGAFDPSS